MQKSEDIYLSVIIPAYNEAHRIRETLRKINEYLGAKKFNSELARGACRNLLSLCISQSGGNFWGGYFTK